MQQLTQEISRQRQADMRGAAARRSLAHAHADRTAPLEIVIRHAEDCDGAALRRLAALDGIEFVPGSWLVADADGRLTAALHLDDGKVIADPFRPTTAVRRVLELWAAQVTGRPGGLRRRLRLA
jgi:hypothetical protein